MSYWSSDVCSSDLMAGRLSDSIGTKRAIVYGLYGIVLSGLLTLLSTLLQSFPLLSLLILIAGRLLLGVAQGLIGVGTISWCMGQVGVEHTARSISWNGIASYGAIAIGAPRGVVMVGEQIGRASGRERVGQYV